MQKIAVINYGSGNVHSAKKAFQKVITDNKLNLEVIVTDNPQVVESASHIIVPGVGAFGDCVSGITKIPNMVKTIKHQVLENKKPFLGICVGMQMLADTGYEHGKFKGLSLIKGEVKKIELNNNLKLPHMGWNNLVEIKENKITKDINEQDNFYFVHSYHFLTDEKNIIAKTNYGQNITAIINKENIWGVQFHPEKSQNLGQKLIKNFLRVRL